MMNKRTVIIFIVAVVAILLFKPSGLKLISSNPEDVATVETTTKETTIQDKIKVVKQASYEATACRSEMENDKSTVKKSCSNLSKLGKLSNKAAAIRDDKDFRKQLESASMDNQLEYSVYIKAWTDDLTLVAKHIEQIIAERKK